MEKQEILDQWHPQRQDRGACVDLWNSMARSFGAAAPPDFSEDRFLRLLEANAMFDSESDILDVGCGTGGYALALAGRCRRVLGVDLSPEMIRVAKEKAAESGVQNVTFQCIDWQEFDLQAAGMENRFDLAFAHLTPAVQDADTFLKLARASRGWCALSKPTHRTDPVSDAVKELVGITAKRESSERDLLYAFSLLWLDGLLPKLDYERQCWRMRKTPEEAMGLYVNRVKSYRELSREEEEKITAYLKSLEKNGMVCEDVETIVATIYWHK